MSSPSLTTSAPAKNPLAPPVAGVVLQTRTERAADAVAHAVIAHLDAIGFARCITVATHWAAPAGRPRHSCLTVQIQADDSDMVWQSLLPGLPSGHERPLALCVGNRQVGPKDLQSAAVSAVEAHSLRSSGRAVHFPGSSTLTGTMSVRDILDASAIDNVRILTAGDADPNLLVHTRDHVRPLWTHGELVLFAQPAVGGTLVPFESPTPTPCCAHHS